MMSTQCGGPVAIDQVVALYRDIHVKSGEPRNLGCEFYNLLTGELLKKTILCLKRMCLIDI